MLILKHLHNDLSPLDATLMKKQGGGAPVMVNQTPDEVSLSELWECGGLPPLFFRPPLVQPKTILIHER